MQFSGDREIFSPDNSLFKSASVEHQIQERRAQHGNFPQSAVLVFHLNEKMINDPQTFSGVEPLK